MARAIYSCTIEGKLISVEAEGYNEAVEKFNALYPDVKIAREDLKIVSLKKMGNVRPSELVAGFKRV